MQSYMYVGHNRRAEDLDDTSGKPRIAQKLVFELFAAFLGEASLVVTYLENLFALQRDLVWL